MKLLCLSTGEEVAVGASLRAVSGITQGHLIKVIEIDEPSDLYLEGRIKHNMEDSIGIQSWQHLLPRVLDCIFIQDDSVVTSATYDNEKSISDTITDIVRKLRDDDREVRKLILGYREWDRIRDLASLPDLPATGTAPPVHFNGVAVTRIRHREQCLAFEHGPVTVEIEG